MPGKFYSPSKHVAQYDRVLVGKDQPKPYKPDVEKIRREASQRSKMDDIIKDRVYLEQRDDDQYKSGRRINSLDGKQVGFNPQFMKGKDQITISL